MNTNIESDINQSAQTHTHPHIPARAMLAVFGICAVVLIPLLVWHTIYRTTVSGYKKESHTIQYDDLFFISCTDKTYQQCNLRYQGKAPMRVVAFDLIFAQNNIQTHAVADFTLLPREKNEHTIITGFTSQLQQKYTQIEPQSNIAKITGLSSTSKTISQDGKTLSQVVFLNTAGVQEVQSLNPLAIRVEIN